MIAGKKAGNTVSSVVVVKEDHDRLTGLAGSATKTKHLHHQPPEGRKEANEFKTMYLTYLAHYRGSMIPMTCSTR